MASVAVVSFGSCGTVFPELELSFWGFVLSFVVFDALFSELELSLSGFVVSFVAFDALFSVLESLLSDFLLLFGLAPNVLFILFYFLLLLRSYPLYPECPF